MELEKYTADFSLLPAHVITRILGFLKIADLKNASTVSKSWYYASTDPEIERTLVLIPREDDFPKICLTNRKYGLLSLQMLNFDKTDSYYYELFEKFGPFLKKLEILSCHIKRHQLLKLFEHTTSLQVISLYHCSQFTWPGLIPLDYDNETKNRISKNLLSIKRMCFIQITSIPVIMGFLQYTPNLERCEICLDLFDKSFDDFFTIFLNYNASSLRYLCLNLKLAGSADEFIKNFIKIENLNLKSIITRILRFLKIADLKNASTVSKSWYYASTDPEIERTLVMNPPEGWFPIICRQSNRKFGVLILTLLDFDKTDSYYYQLFEKFGPFVTKLEVLSCLIKRHQLLKLFEHSSSLQVVSLYYCSQMTWPELIPLNYDYEAKNRIAKNLSGIRAMHLIGIISIPVIAGFLQYTPNLEKCEIYLDLYGTSFEEFSSIFFKYNASSLRYLYLNLKLAGSVDEFIKKFIKIENLNLKSLSILLQWNWQDMTYKSSLFRQFVMKLQSLEELVINALNRDQLIIISQHLKNLKYLDCRQLENNALISELVNLKQLEKLRYKAKRDFYDQYHDAVIIEIDKFFHCKFENLRVFYFGEFVTEKNLKQFCENHPNLIELKLACLITTNLEIIFKNLTKLRVLDICFGFYWLTENDLENKDFSFFDSNNDYEYKLSRLQDLEELILSERVSGIREDDVRQLKKLRSTNLTFN